MSERQMFADAAARARCPEDQMRNFVVAQTWLQERQLVASEPADVCGLQWMRRQDATRCPAVEQEQVHREAAEAHPLAVDHAQQLHRLALDARLLQHLLQRHFAG